MLGGYFKPYILGERAAYFLVISFVIMKGEKICPAV